MKKILSLLLLLFASCINLAYAQSYTFKENSKKIEDLELVKFSNGESIKNVKASPNSKEFWSYKIGFFDSKGKAKYRSESIQNDIVSIEAAYLNLLTKHPRQSLVYQTYKGLKATNTKVGGGTLVRNTKGFDRKREKKRATFVQ